MYEKNNKRKAFKTKQKLGNSLAGSSPDGILHWLLEAALAGWLLPFLHPRMCCTNGGWADAAPGPVCQLS